MIETSSWTRRKAILVAAMVRSNRLFSMRRNMGSPGRQCPAKRFGTCRTMAVHRGTAADGVADQPRIRQALRQVELAPPALDWGTAVGWAYCHALLNITISKQPSLG